MNTIVKIFPKICSCCRFLGKIQQEFEEHIENYINNGNSLNESQKLACEYFNIKLMCCLNNILNSSTYFVVDTYFNSILVNGVSLKNLKSENGLKTITEIEAPDIPLL